MTLEEIESAIEDKSIYSFNKQQLAECLKVVAAIEVGGNLNFHARLSKVNSFLTYLADELSNREQLKWNKIISFTAIGISVVSLSVAVCTYLASSKWNENALDQLKSEISAVQRQEHKIFLLLSSSQVRTRLDNSATQEKQKSTRSFLPKRRRSV